MWVCVWGGGGCAGAWGHGGGTDWRWALIRINMMFDQAMTCSVRLFELKYDKICFILGHVQETKTRCFRRFFPFLSDISGFYLLLPSLQNILI